MGALQLAVTVPERTSPIERSDAKKTPEKSPNTGFPVLISTKDWAPENVMVVAAVIISPKAYPGFAATFGLTKKRALGVLAGKEFGSVPDTRKLRLVSVREKLVMLIAPLAS